MPCRKICFCLSTCTKQLSNQMKDWLNCCLAFFQNLHNVALCCDKTTIRFGHISQCATVKQEPLRLRPASPTVVSASPLNKHHPHTGLSGWICLRMIGCLRSIASFSEKLAVSTSMRTGNPACVVVKWIPYP